MPRVHLRRDLPPGWMWAPTEGMRGLFDDGRAAMTIDRAEAFEADIAASPAALARCLEAWRPVALGGRSRFAFTGLGSSRYAALIVASALRASGTMAWAEYASSSTPTAPADDLVLVAISASGRTPEVVGCAAAEWWLTRMGLLIGVPFNLFLMEFHRLLTKTPPVCR